MSIKSIFNSASVKVGSAVTAAYVLGTSAVYAADTSSGVATAASNVLDSAQADVTSTSPKVMLVVGGVVLVGIMIALLRKAH